MAEHDFMFSGEIVQNPRTGRWFIGAGQPGFNCDTNNRLGWSDRSYAVSARNRYAMAGKPMNLETAIEVIAELENMLAKIGLGDKVPSEDVMSAWDKANIFTTRYKMFPQERS